MTTTERKPHEDEVKAGPVPDPLPTHAELMPAGPMLNEASIAGMVSKAISQLGGEGATAAVDAIKELVGLRHAEEDRHARREFARAMALYRQYRVPIKRNKIANKGASRDGVQRIERYTDLAEIERSQGPTLSALGFSWRWENVEVEAGARFVAVRTVLSHEMGHEVSSIVKVPVDSGAKMNDTQKHGSSNTYAQRYGLIQVLGLTTTDPGADTDGVDPDKRRPISEDQVLHLESLLQESGRAEGKFLSWIGVAKVSDVPVYRYDEAVKMLGIAIIRRSQP